MDQEKIGKFIGKCRKEKGFTQQELAEKLGVSDRTVGNWENGRNMPDMSLFKPLCEVLDITINDLLSGEVVDKKNYEKKLEENIVKTITYSKNKIDRQNNIMGIILIIIGILIAITALTIFPSESSWGSVYSVLGVIISMIGISKFTKRLSYVVRVICNFGYFIIFILLLMIIDYIGVINIHQAPRYALVKVSGESMIYYDTIFYDVYRCNKDTEFETFNVVKNGKINENYCDSVVEKRIDKYEEHAWNKAEIIELYTYIDIDKKDGENIIRDEFNGNYYVLNKTINDRKGIENIIDLLSDAKYTELINDVLYTKLFRVYDSDYNLLIEFDFNTLTSFDTKETIGIYFDDDTWKKLNEYFD